MKRPPTHLLLVLLLAPGACTRQGFGPATGVMDGGRGEGRSTERWAGDGAAGEARSRELSVGMDLGPPQCRWSGSFALSTPTPVSEIPDGAGKPYLSPDELLLIFFSYNDGQLYSATRTSRDVPFGNIQSYDTLNTPYDETGLRLTADGLTGFLTTTRPGAGTSGLSDIWMGTRPDTSQPFTSAEFSPLTEVNSAANEWDPFPSADGLRLYFDGVSRLGPNGSDDLMVAERASIAAQFSTPVAIPGVNAADVSEGNPTLTADECVIVFNSERPGGLGSADLWYATRASRILPFSAPQPVPGVNSAAPEGESFLTLDGCTLYFARAHRLYRSTYVSAN